VSSEQSLEKSCRENIATLGYSWTWDARFETATFTFEKEHGPGLLGAAHEILPGSWTVINVRDAGARVRSLADDMGGLREGQVLLTARVSDAEPMLFGAVWPWGNGKNVSLRVGCDSGGAERGEWVTRLKAWFNTR
jgi:hypothetical protein